MKKLIFLFLIYSTTLLASGLGESSSGDGSRFVCTLDERGETTTFLCLNKETGERFDREIEPIETMSVVATLRDEGVQFVTPDEANYSEL